MPHGLSHRAPPRIYFRRIGSHSGSPALSKAFLWRAQAAGFVRKALDAFLTNPAAVVPGTSMAFYVGTLEDEGQRRDLIDFLKEPDNSLDICP